MSGHRPSPLPYLLALAWIIGPAPIARAADPIKGVVQDGIGSPVANARVSFVSGGVSVQTVTADDGTFTFDPGLATGGRLTVVAEGFSPFEREWKSGERVTLTLVRVPFVTEVTVTASRVEEKLGDTPARVVVLGEASVRESPSTSVDDVLRQVPGFSLFRRMGSRGANPTSQGASLRGVGPSGASRTLVLLDGVPLNDPFGGWVYWSRVPRTSIQKIEVLEGGASDLYGSAALGGVIQILTNTNQRAVNTELHAGGQSTAGGSLHAVTSKNDWTYRFSGEAFTTDGWVIADPAQRGLVDTEAGSRHLTGNVAIERRWENGGRAFLRGGGFGEERTNGTPLQDNDTSRFEVSAGGDWSPASGSLSVRAWYSDQTYNQTFSSVAVGRATEALTRSQAVPTSATGGSIVWSRAFNSRFALVTGVEGRIVSGHSDEAVYTAGNISSYVDAGGDETTVAAFGHLRSAFGSKGVASIGVRLDRWSESDGSTMSRPASSGIPTLTTYPDRSSTRLSPRVSLLFRPSSQVRLNAAAYGSFRGPTLNELYRSFRVGDTFTLANPKLTEERLTGVEGGVSWSRSDERLHLRSVFFRSIVDDPVANVTLTATPTLITRERRNLGQTLSRGVSLEGEFNINASFQASAGYTFVNALIREFSADPSIQGNRVPQVPRGHFTFEGRFSQPRLFTLVLQGRWSGSQFEDDQNRLLLPECFSLDARASRQVSRRFEVFGAAENITDKPCAAGITPLTTIGPPRLLRVGIRIN